MIDNSQYFTNGAYTSIELLSELLEAHEASASIVCRGLSNETISVMSQASSCGGGTECIVAKMIMSMCV